MAASYAKFPPRSRLREANPGSIRVVGKVCGQQPLGLANLDALARGVGSDLVALALAEREVACLRMREVEAAHRRRGQHREALGETHADRFRLEELEEPRLLRVLGARGVSESRPDAAIL